MTLFSENPRQFELFPSEQKAETARSRPRFFLTNFTLSLENIILVSVMIILSVVMAFSWGVERGKDKETVQAPAEPPPVQEARPVTPAPVQEVVPVAAAAAEEAPLPAVVQADPAPAAAAEAPSEKNIDKLYTIQVASYNKEEYAQREGANLKKDGYDIFVLPKGNYSILCVGKFKDKDKAKAFSTKLRKRYKDCLVRSF